MGHLPRFVHDSHVSHARSNTLSALSGMRIDDPQPTYSYLVGRLSDSYPELAYIHVVEPRLQSNGEYPPNEASAIFESSNLLCTHKSFRATISFGQSGLQDRLSAPAATLAHPRSRLQMRKATSLPLDMRSLLM